MPLNGGLLRVLWPPDIRSHPGTLTGAWENDQRHGIGKYYYFNGDVYDGSWQNHVRHGHGEYTYGDSGIKWTGTWNNGVRVTDVNQVQQAAQDSVRTHNVFRRFLGLWIVWLGRMQ